jgi:hypothetical protein
MRKKEAGVERTLERNIWRAKKVAECTIDHNTHSSPFCLIIGYFHRTNYTFPWTSLYRGTPKR